MGRDGADEEGPEAGHTFRITYESRGSYSVVGDPEGPRDAPEFQGDRHTVEVRAWSLREALRKAAELPFAELMGEAAAKRARVIERELREAEAARGGGPRRGRGPRNR